jgi:hypothetical protein
MVRAPAGGRRNSSYHAIRRFGGSQQAKDAAVMARS